MEESKKNQLKRINKLNNKKIMYAWFSENYYNKYNIKFKAKNLYGKFIFYTTISSHDICPYIIDSIYYLDCKFVDLIFFDIS